MHSTTLFYWDVLKQVVWWIVLSTFKIVEVLNYEIIPYYHYKEIGPFFCTEIQPFYEAFEIANLHHF